MFIIAARSDLRKVIKQMSKIILSYADYGKKPEIGTAVFTGVDLTAANIVAESAKADTLRTELEKITLGGIQKRELVAWVNNTKIAATEPFAQREIKWVVFYHDNSTGKVWNVELPCADLAKLDPNTSDRADMTDADVITFVAAFEAFQRSPVGNEVTVDYIAFAGRNS